MKELKLTLPEKQEYFKLTHEEQSALLEQIEGVINEVDKSLYELLALRLAPIFEEHSEIESIALDPSYEYNDEGYAPNYIMPWINGNYDAYSSEDGEDDWRSEIEDAVKDIASYVREQIEFDRDILVQYRKEKLDDNLETKTDIKNRFKV